MSGGKRGRLRAGVLVTVVVTATLLLLLLAGVMWLWEADFLLFSRTNYLRLQRANMESAFTLYRHDPAIMQRLDADGTFLLYDSLPGSRMKFAVEPWGLYEAVSVTTGDGRLHSTRLMAACETGADHAVFRYRNNNGSLTLAGNTNIKGKACLPRNGVVYGQMQSVFFSGEKLNPADIQRSEESLPPPCEAAKATIKTLFALQGEERGIDSLHTAFYGNAATVIKLDSGTLMGSRLTGRIVLRANKLHLDASCRFRDIIVAARCVSVGDGFRGRLQIFASDSVTLGRNVTLESPSGIYCEKYAEVGEGSEVNGYLITDCPDKPDPKKPNLRKAVTSRLRGLLYVEGVAMLQGIVTGAAVVGESVYYSPQGYYRHMLYEASILGCEAVGYPFWLGDKQKRKEVAWPD